MCAEQKTSVVLRIVVVFVIALAVVDHNRLIFLPGVVAATATIRSFDVPLIIFCGKICRNNSFLPSVVKHDNRNDDDDCQQLMLLH